MRKIFYILLTLSFLFTFSINAFAHTEDDPLVTDLIAGGGNVKSSMDVGDVLVWNDGENLYVRYEVTEPLCITKTHLQVAIALDMIPQTKKGNPIPGKFEHKGMHDCVTSFTVPIILNTWVPGTELYIAAHAVVGMELMVEDQLVFIDETAWGDGLDFPGRNWATFFTYTIQSPQIFCMNSTDCSIENCCEKAIGDCLGEGTCEEKPVACIDIWDPVCGCDGNTYNNECFAVLNGISIDYPGECTIECAHDLCIEGEALDPSCDPCVETVCNFGPYGYCCEIAWDYWCTFFACDMNCGME